MLSFQIYVYYVQKYCLDNLQGVQGETNCCWNKFTCCCLPWSVSSQLRTKLARSKCQTSFGKWLQCPWIFVLMNGVCIFETPVPSAAASCRNDVKLQSCKSAKPVNAMLSGLPVKLNHHIVHFKISSLWETVCQTPIISRKNFPRREQINTIPLSIDSVVPVHEGVARKQRWSLHDPTLCVNHVLKGACVLSPASLREQVHEICSHPTNICLCMECMEESGQYFSQRQILEQSHHSRDNGVTMVNQGKVGTVVIHLSFWRIEKHLIFCALQHNSADGW